MSIDEAIKLLQHAKNTGTKSIVISWWDASMFGLDDDHDWLSLTQEIEDNFDWSGTHDKMQDCIDEIKTQTV